MSLAAILPALRPPAALASVARRRGSLPMSATAKLLVTAGGARTGTVGGGCLEAEIVEKALDVCERRVPLLSTHTLNAEAAGDYGLTCGGTAHVVVEPVLDDPRLLEVWRAVRELLARDARGVLVTSLDWRDGPAKCLVDERGHVTGDRRLAHLAAHLPLDGESPLLLDDADVPVLVEPVSASPRLVVVGAGHVGAAIARAAHAAGWRVTVADDRAEYADPARFPFAERVVVQDYHDLAPALRCDARTWAVVCTRGHQHDAVVVAQLAPLPLRYLGMLGSRRKVALAWELLERWGVSRERLEGVHAPVGLAIGADTPEEIAVSVVAEMIAVRRSRSRRRGGVSAPETAENDSCAPRVEDAASVADFPTDPLP